MLLAELNADNLILELFTDFFDIVRTDTTQTVMVCIKDILQQIVEELSYLPQGVIEVIMARFSKKAQVFTFN